MGVQNFNFATTFPQNRGHTAQNFVQVEEKIGVVSFSFASKYPNYWDFQPQILLLFFK